jgi:hypothetical protein
MCNYIIYSTKIAGKIFFLKWYNGFKFNMKIFCSELLIECRIFGDVIESTYLCPVAYVIDIVI